MRAIRRIALAATIAASALGCRSGGGSVSQRPIFSSAGSEPPLIIGNAEPGGSVAAASPPSVVARAPSWVDRHPMFSKPRQMYESTNGNAVVKSGSAVLVGVPVGVVGEIRQVFTGNQPSTAAVTPAAPAH
ncbi:MAG: hypothetical protein U0800_13955 [Isosphaeraceae bacterium]